MSYNRKKFIQTAFGSLAAAAFPLPAMDDNYKKDKFLGFAATDIVQADDENYWKEFAATYYSPDPGIINLENGYFGVQP